MKKTLSGFTLVELLLAMGIFTLILAVLLRIFTQVIEMRLDAEATSAVTQDAQYVTTRLAYDIARASAVVLPAAPGESGSTLRLTIEGEQITYTRTAEGQIVRTTPSSSASLTGSGSRATALTFIRRGGTEGTQSITYDCTLESVTERVDGPVVRQIHATAGTRL